MKTLTICFAVFLILCGSNAVRANNIFFDLSPDEIEEAIQYGKTADYKMNEFGGYDLGLNGEAWRSIQFQNANNSVRLTDDFFERAERGDRWSAAHVAAGVAVLEAPKIDGVEAGPRHNTHLPGPGYGPREAPVGDSGPHSALDENR